MYYVLLNAYQFFSHESFYHSHGKNNMAGIMPWLCLQSRQADGHCPTIQQSFIPTYFQVQAIDRGFERNFSNTYMYDCTYKFIAVATLKAS